MSALVIGPGSASRHVPVGTDSVAVIVCVVVVLLVLLVCCFLFASRFRPMADRKAGELLHDVLTPDEYRQLAREGHVDIMSPSDPARVYRVPRYPGLVQVRECGRVKEYLCVQPFMWVPDADLVVIHKLMIQANEAIYLQTANRHIAFLSF